MVPLREGSTFKQLLEELQDLQSYAVNVVVSAAKFKISSLKKDTSKYLRDGMPKEVVVELRTLERAVGSINRKYFNGVLSSTNVKSLSKKEILTELENRNNEIERLVDGSSVGTVYKIINLNTEYVSPIVKKK